MKIHLTLALVTGSALALIAASPQKPGPSSEKVMVKPHANELQRFLQDFEKRASSIYAKSSIASYDASISGKAEDYQKSERLQLELKKLYSDPKLFSQIKAFRAAKTKQNPIQKRQLELIYLQCLGNQLPEKTLAELVRQQTDIEKTYNTHRASLDGKPVSDNELDNILSTSTDRQKLETTWKASKEIGQKTAPAIIQLVKLRNQTAKEMGFTNFQAMQLALGEQDPKEIESLFDELDELTRKDYLQVKKEIDSHLAKRLGIKENELQPWHYQDRFFQEAPKIHPVDLDAIYANQDLVKLVQGYFKGIGLDVDDILKHSDLFEKTGKYQHAFCTDIDHSGDVRILCSLKPNSKWAGTLMHELGHGVYSKFNDPKLPWLLRDSAHAFTTEAMANFFGRMTSNPVWIQDCVGMDKAEVQKISQALSDTLRTEQLVFSRWSQVMFRFEKAMYENPDQDLDQLWWDLVERYQMIRRPKDRKASDWASKIHVALYPAYYHNYLLGQLLASQLEHHITHSRLKKSGPQSYTNKKEVGQFLINNVFKPGMRYPWNGMIEKATGEKLTAKYYALQFIR